MHRFLLAAPFLPLLSGCGSPAHAVPGDSDDESDWGDGDGSGPTSAAECAPVMALGCGVTWSADTTDPNDGATTVLETYPDIVGQYGGPEIVYAFAADTAAMVSVNLVDPDPMAVDQDLLLLQDLDGVCSPLGTLARGFHSLEWEAAAGALYYVVVDGYGGDAGRFEATVSCSEPAVDPALSTDEADVGCASFDSTLEEDAPIQRTGADLPAGAESLLWTVPTEWTARVDFAGIPGENATHEGIDFIHDDGSVPVVSVLAAADGNVVYVRRGCLESTRLGHNESMRECGAGWGNHIVIDHGEGVFTRYGHLDNADINVQVGDAVEGGERIAGMGNSGRSETRHLHFELGTRGLAFDSCEPAQSFDRVYAPERLGL